MKDNNDKSVTITKIIDLIKKEPITGAYTQTFIEDILEKEIIRSHRYKTELSIVLIEINLDKDKDIDKIYRFFGKLILKKIRTNDYFGRFDDGRLVIIVPNTSLSGAMVLAEKLENIYSLQTDFTANIDISFGITQVDDLDSYSSTMEKLNEAISRAKSKTTQGRIEIEV
jgi:diguanylate cyclase (GGDEF)-like protein